MKLQPFQGAEHLPFLWEGNTGAALCIHGFPGTPAEVRPLAALLRAQGWTVEAILLPGFGAQFLSLASYGWRDWVAAASAAMARLQARHETVLLLGLSMGAALALEVAVAQPPAGLCLIAPFQRLGQPWLDLLWPLLRLTVRSWRPLRHANFADPRTLGELTRILPGVDLADPAVQAAIRCLSFPASVLDELGQAGRSVRRCAPRLRLPALVVQGQQDLVALPALTRTLVRRLGAGVDYWEIPAGHSCWQPLDSGWPYLRRALFDYAKKL